MEIYSRPGKNFSQAIKYRLWALLKTIQTTSPCEWFLPVFRYCRRGVVGHFHSKPYKNTSEFFNNQILNPKNNKALALMNLMLCLKPRCSKITRFKESKSSVHYYYITKSSRFRPCMSKKITDTYFRLIKILIWTNLNHINSSLSMVFLVISVWTARCDKLH